MSLVIWVIRSAQVGSVVVCLCIDFCGIDSAKPASFHGHLYPRAYGLVILTSYAEDRNISVEFPDFHDESLVSFAPTRERWLLAGRKVVTAQVDDYYVRSVCRSPRGLCELVEGLAVELYHILVLVKIVVVADYTPSAMTDVHCFGIEVSGQYVRVGE